MTFCDISSTRRSDPRQPTANPQREGAAGARNCESIAFTVGRVDDPQASVNKFDTEESSGELTCALHGDASIHEIPLSLGQRKEADRITPASHEPIRSWLHVLRIPVAKRASVVLLIHLIYSNSNSLAFIEFL